MGLKETALTLLGKTILLGKRWMHKLKTQIPTHVQELIWFNINPRGEFQCSPIFEIMSPHYLWMSQWDDESAAKNTPSPILRHPFKEIPTKGFFLWVIWDSQYGARRYICLKATEFKDVFYDMSQINDLFALQDRAILKRIRTFTYMDSIIHRKDHRLMDITIAINDQPTSLLKPLTAVGLEESIYIPKNLTGGALLWVYLYITRSLPDSGVLPASKMTLTDYELEERVIDLNESLFE
jgi:hypothetical protein